MIWHYKEQLAVIIFLSWWRQPIFAKTWKNLICEVKAERAKMSLRPSDLSFTYCLNKTLIALSSGKGHISIPSCNNPSCLPPGEVGLACVAPKLLWVVSRTLGVPIHPTPILNGLCLLMVPLLLLGMIIGKCCTMPLSVWFLVVAGLGPSGSWRLCR